MEEVLSNQQARPGDATQLMHVIFSSDDEMMSFYLTLNRFMNPESYLVAVSYTHLTLPTNRSKETGGFS